MIDFTFGAKPPIDTHILLGFVHNDEEANLCYETKTFFCHALEWSKESPRLSDGSGVSGEPSKVELSRYDLLVLHNRGRSTPWVAKVVDVKLVSAAERAAELGRRLIEMGAAYYYRFQLDDFRKADSRDVSSITQKRPGKPITCSLDEFATCPFWCLA